LLGGIPVAPPLLLLTPKPTPKQIAAITKKETMAIKTRLCFVYHGS
jgi:hypothetical protein